MIPHWPFFRAIAATQSDSPAFRSLVAGLRVVQLAEKVCEVGWSGQSATESVAIHQAQQYVASMAQNDPTRDFLEACVSAVMASTPMTVPHHLASALLAYSDALRQIGNPELAHDVLVTRQCLVRNAE